MSQDAVGRPRLALTPEQLGGLRAAFTQEVTARLTPLCEAAARLALTSDPSDARIVLEHAHTLASSAVILGEDLAAFHARRCEQALLPYVGAEAGPVPPGVAQETAETADTLGVLLGPWLLGTAVAGDC